MATGYFETSPPLKLEQVGVKYTVLKYTAIKFVHIMEGIFQKASFSLTQNVILMWTGYQNTK